MKLLKLWKLSSGQVHLASLHNGRDVAVKVQYPGVAKGINSDIDNLVGVMKVHFEAYIDDAVLTMQHFFRGRIPKIINWLQN